MRALTSNQHDLSQNLNMILLKSMDVNRRWRLVISLALVLVLLLTKMSYDLRKWNVSFPSPIFKFLYSTPINLNSAIHYSKIIFSLKAESLADVNIEPSKHGAVETADSELCVCCASGDKQSFDKQLSKLSLLLTRVEEGILGMKIYQKTGCLWPMTNH